MIATALLVCAWVTADGTVEFTGDTNRIPSAYQADALCAELSDGLEGYEHFTRDDSPFVPKTASQDAPGSTIVDELVPQAPPETVTPITKERRRKRHRSDRS